MSPKFFAAVFFLPVAVSANACVPDTLTNYETLGSGGCTIQGLTFSNFAFSTVFASGGVTPVDASQINVDPVAFDSLAGLNFASSGFTVSAGQSVQYRLTWDVDDPPIIHGWDLELFDPVTFPAVVTIVSNECLGAAFAGTVCPTSSIATNTVFDNGMTAVLNSTQFFAPVVTVGELTTITLDATAGGSASFNSFTESALETPEPSSVVLTLSFGLLMLLLAHRARGRLLQKPS